MKATLKMIKRIREDKNISREEMADKLNMSLSGYAKIERGEVALTILRLEQIGQILNYTSTEIIEMGNQNTLILCPTIEKTTIPIQSSDSLQLSDKDLYIQFLEKRIHELKQRSQELEESMRRGS
ncbi:MAG: XRE family transcriptional regulator [Bacteroidetes bacterium]|jgi:transcriptional regulator with XRE-family HTH domain|nr:XRE family transcriptional regulator [Bacteroidota bacterium]